MCPKRRVLLKFGVSLCLIFTITWKEVNDVWKYT